MTLTQCRERREEGERGGRGEGEEDTDTRLRALAADLSLLRERLRSRDLDRRRLSLDRSRFLPGDRLFFLSLLRLLRLLSRVLLFLLSRERDTDLFFLSLQYDKLCLDSITIHWHSAAQWHRQHDIRDKSKAKPTLKICDCSFEVTAISDALYNTCMASIRDINP